MPKPSSLAVLALLATAVPAPARADVPDKVPLDAPAACIDPTAKNGLSTVLASGPKAVGTYKLIEGKALDIPGLRLLANARFIPERMGSTKGEVVAGMSAALLPDVDRDGENPDNSVDNNGLGEMRIANYRITMRVVEAKPKKSVFEAVVEEIGCRERAVHPPLAPGASKTFWVSTQATKTYAFSIGDWYEQFPEMYFAVTADLDPDVQQTAGTKTPHGWIHVQAWERENGLPSWDDRYIDKIKPGTRMDLPAHQVEIIKVVLGADTSVVEDRVMTKGKPPIVSVLVKVTRKLKPSTELIRRN